MHKTSAQNAHKTAQSPAHNPPLPRRGRGCVHGVVQALGTVHSETAREATRRALEKASPGLLAWCRSCRRIHMAAMRAASKAA